MDKKLFLTDRVCQTKHCVSIENRPVVTVAGESEDSLPIIKDVDKARQ